MKYLFTKVRFNYDGFGLTALYINNDLYIKGDKTFDEDDSICGFIAGVRYAVAEGFCCEMMVKDYFIEESVDAGEVPNTLSEVKDRWSQK